MSEVGEGKRYSTAAKHTKIVHGILQKVQTHVAVTLFVIEDHFGLVHATQLVMRELNKHSLLGIEKRQLAIAIITLLLESVGAPPFAADISSRLIADTIEAIYHSNAHRFKSKRKCSLQ